MEILVLSNLLNIILNASVFNINRKLISFYLLPFNLNKIATLNTIAKIVIYFLLFLCTSVGLSQHQQFLTAELLPNEKLILIKQELIYHNTSEFTLYKIVLNDWNNSFSEKNTPLAKRFSDEHYRGFHLASSKDRGSTNNLSVLDAENKMVDWCRPDKHPDLVEILLSKPLHPNEKVKLNLLYYIKIPNDKFTRYGFDISGGYQLRNWFLTPARLEGYQFVNYSNLNLEDIANDMFNVRLNFKSSKFLKITSDLNVSKILTDTLNQTHQFEGRNRTNFTLFIEPRLSYNSYKNDKVEVVTNLEGNKVDDIQKAIAIDRVVNFVSENIGPYPYEKITIAQVDYDRNPFYGLNQLPTFLSPFPNELLFELKFLKTYTSSFLETSLHLDPRKDNWIYDGIQVYLMMNYIEEHYPDLTMMGNISKLRLLKGYHLMNIGFNEQYSYFYLLMARKNLDQAVGNSKDTFLKFNEQIAGKYRAGLSLKYLDSYLGNELVSASIKDFYKSNLNQITSSKSFRDVLTQKTDKNLDWFYDTVINSRKLIDYKFTTVTKNADSITATIENKTGTAVPFPIYVFKNKQVIFKQWIEGFEKDSTITLPNQKADKIALNYENEVPEINQGNNWRSLKTFHLTNKPFKFSFFQDLEDSRYHQVLYVPILNYNLYDGFMPGIRFYNKTILNRPFIYDLNPVWGIKSKTFVGSFSFLYTQNNRNSEWYQTTYSLSGSRFHYAPDAEFYKFNPMVIFKKRQKDFRDNHREQLLFRYVLIDRQQTDFIDITDTENNQDYSIFNIKYLNSRTEVLSHLSFKGDMQFDQTFGKGSFELEYRKLDEKNRQFNIRWYVGTFLYQTTDTDFYDFGVSQVNDYLFDYNLYGRSETSGFFSQQYVVGEGGFKSRIDTKLSNKWLTTLNTSYSIWNWIELYGDIGLVKNENIKTEFIHESGIRLNLLTDYFEIYMPIYSNNGFEMDQGNYLSKMRFMFTLNPNTLIGLFTRKWF